MLLGKIKRIVHRIYANGEYLEDISRRMADMEHRLYLMEKSDGLNRCTDKIIDTINRKDWEQNKFLYGRLQDVAGYQTAQFIIDNMNKVPVLVDSLSILDKSIEKLEIDGLFLEFGVFQGRTINRISSLIKNTVYGFDSFEGLPEDWRSGFSKGMFDVENLPIVNDNVELVKGWFDKTLPDFLKEHKDNCAFIHIDCDLYSSTKYVLNALKDRIVPGTIISFDEYFNYPGWQEGEFKAFKEFCEDNNIEFDYLYYVDTHEQVSVRISRI